jgi:hypothetical protein
MDISVITLCEQLIRDIANKMARSVKEDQPFRETVIKKLKFSNIGDWNVLCSLMDVLGDTELAKENFFKFDLSGPTRILDHGEQYLRLYGIVNAVYLQKSALIALIELVKLNDKKRVVERIESLKMLELRHIAGAHTVNFLDNGVKNPHQIQRSFGGDRKITARDSKGVFKDYNLKDLLTEYNSVAQELIIQASEKFIDTVFEKGNTSKAKYQDRLTLIKSQNMGNRVFYFPDGGSFSIRVVE